MRDKCIKSIIVLFLFMGTAALGAIPASGTERETKATVENKPLDLLEKMSPGWNLGNTLDAVPTEGSWNNPPVQEHTFDDIREAGFKSVRIPVTWDSHIGGAPDYKIAPEWMNRVEQVTDWALKRDFYVVLNVHHDSWLWINRMGSSQQETLEKLGKVWTQIADRFKNKSDRLLFEIVNEPTGMSAYQLNLLNREMLRMIRATGGQNAERLVIVGGLEDNKDELLNTFEPPDDDRIVLTFHYYSPWDYVSNWWGRTTWGTSKDIEDMERDIKPVYETFVAKGYPVIIGEYGTLGANEKYSKRLYHDALVGLAHKYQMVTMWWDNGNDQFDRTTRTWRDPVVKDIVIQAGRGISNAIVNPGDLYIRKGQSITDQTMEIRLSGNKFAGIRHRSEQLQNGTDYTVSGQSVTIKASYLAKLIDGSPAFGTKAELTFAFDKGASQVADVILYGAPKLEKDEFTISRSNIKGDLEIPASLNGTKLATVKGVVDSTGRPVLEDVWSWTPYLNYDEDFYEKAGKLYLRERVLHFLKSDSTFTFEMWPKGVEVAVKVKVTP
ncbi:MULTISPECIES: cellulase family glycosylhydrolase [Bacillus]|uniref:Glycoside hydrolase n=1 Tax=Bacillus glycinifermentans TaxID=1664069 RepID=A0AAJ4D2Q1_9BACI|nr:MULTISPECIES: cellulase family glycosylhydrolase [Bacillus]KKB75567.1 glycoside hydrolase [Bacillus sp. TH008]MDU0071267.1 cellulase family glycosylhydrolase [Bacillus sp. IG6]MED8019218.1 cellulase family glycosylhydrolase [Bacillus glycinifermentans]NUJ17170.1 cellulase family glycosylhydrolase [Bacillus glycinifermentans]QAT65156.1 glycoside hydrolase [Bacillus glycinifermentans]